MRRHTILLICTLLSTTLLSSTVSASSTTPSSSPYGLSGTSLAAAAQEYYVSASGRDPSNCSGGTQSSPWKTWAKAEQCVPAGSTVYFMAGNYSSFSGSSRSRITFKGSADQPISIRPAPGDEGRVFFNRALEIYGGHGVISGININASSTWSAISVYQAHHVLFEYNMIHGSSVQDCVHIHKNSDSISFVGNEVYDCGYQNSRYSGPGDGIDMTGGTNIVYRGNHIHDAMNGFQIKGGSRNVLVENNRIHNVGAGIFGASMGALSEPNPQHGNSEMHNPAVAIEDRYQAKGLTIRNNLIYNTTSFNAVSAKGWVDFQIYNNTIFNHRGSTVFYVSGAYWEFFDSTALAYCQTHACSPCTSYYGSRSCVSILLRSKNGSVKNNIAHTFSQRGFTAEYGSTAGLESAHNIYYSSGISRDSYGKFAVNGTSYSLRGFQSLGYEMRSDITDPQLWNVSNVANPDLRLKPTSPAIDRGLYLSAVPQDFVATRRPQGAVHDPGAYEYAQFKGQFKSFLPLVIDQY
jgi:hypothetical protein